MKSKQVTYCLIGLFVLLMFFILRQEMYIKPDVVYVDKHVEKVAEFVDPTIPPIKPTLPIEYSQVGILTAKPDLILLLMGRYMGRDKWQYYTISNTGNINTKLPIKINGRSCMNEYGCNVLNTSDVVFVEGYNHTFIVTLYENNWLYNPFI